MADYNMRNSGASVDDIVENGLDKRVGGDVTGDVTVAGVVKATELASDTLETADKSLSIGISSLCSTNIANIGGNTIPTVDPGISGRIWNDNGTLKVSV